MRVRLDKMHRTSCATSNCLSTPSFLGKKGQHSNGENLNYQVFGRFTAKIVLGVFALFYLASYQPSISLPSFKPTIVFAQEPQQTQTITPAQSAIQFQLPHPGYLTTSFSNYHPGIDIATGLGMPIRPLTKGIVTEAGYNFWGLGLMVEVEHTGGFKSLYAHMGKIYVEKGKEVDVGDLLGEVGLTGHTTGPHTHLELSKDGQKIDPRPLLPELRNFPKDEDFKVYSSTTPSIVEIPASASAALKTETPIESKPSPSPILPSPALYFPSASPVEEEIIEKKPVSVEELEQVIAQKKLDSILSVAKPLPSTPPIPQGGGYKLLSLNPFKSIK